MSAASGKGLLAITIVFLLFAVWIDAAPPYSFEGGLDGWQITDYAQAQAITNIVSSGNWSTVGTNSLRMQLNLIGSDYSQSAGEVYVECLPCNLDGETVSASVYCPYYAGGTDPSHWNGMQLFVKDTNWNSRYSEWFNITPKQISIKHISMVVSTNAAQTEDGEYMDAGFDPGSIHVVGLKVACGDGSTSTYSGVLYMDNVTFDVAYSNPVVTNVQYDFESNEEGFLPATAGSTAITSVEQTTNQVLNGSGALQLNVDLDGADTNDAAGEVTLDLQLFGPANVESPIDFDGKELAFYVYCPAGSRGDGGAANGLQLIAKDGEYRSEYGSWTPIVEGVWRKVSLTPSTSAPTNGYMDSGFDPQSICTIGLKISAADSSSATYTGPVYADAFCFEASEVSQSDLRYSFEDNKEGWQAEDYPGLTAITSVVRDASYSQDGTYGLKMNVAASVAGTNVAQGSAWVDMRYYPPPTVRGPFNLTGDVVRAYVYCPANFPETNWSQPSTARILVKSGTNFVAEYGASKALKAGGWTMISLAPSTDTPDGGFMQDGFNPEDICAVGVDVTMGSSYTGPMYIDYVSFPAEAEAMPSSEHAYGFEADTQALWSQWDVDPVGMEAEAWTNVYYSTNSGYGGTVALAADAVFGDTNAPMEERKGVFLISYNPALNLKSKDHRTVQAKLKFDPPVEGLLSFNATISLYDKVTDQWYTKDFAVGGSGWNILTFDLDDSSDYDQGSPLPMDASSVGFVAVQVFANQAYSGTILLDDVVIGGEEQAGYYSSITGGMVKRDGHLLTLDDAPFYFAGANIEYLTQVPDSVVVELLDLASDIHVPVVRAWAFHEGMPYSFQPEPGVWNEMAFEQLDRIIAQAGDNGIRLMLGLVDNWGHNGGMFTYMQWVQENYPESLPEDLRSTNMLGTVELHDEFFVNTYAKQWYRDYVTVLLNRTNMITGLKYVDDPTIFGWEIVNEPRCSTDADEDRPYGQRVYNWIMEMSDFVRELDTNHLLSAGEEGGYITTFTNAQTKGFYQDYINSYWLYGLKGEENSGAGAMADFVGDYASQDITIEWQTGTPENPGVVYSETRGGATNIDVCPFRLYLDRMEYNLYRTNFNGYDQRLEWIREHARDAHDIMNKPLILEEFGVHAHGWTYGGYYGQYQYEPQPRYSKELRVGVYETIYDFVEQEGLNGSFFWNLGYSNMWVDAWDLCEQVGGWHASTWDSDAKSVALDSNYVREGSAALKLSLDASIGKGNAIFHLATNEHWLVRVDNGEVVGVNRAHYYWDIYNPGSNVEVALALKVGSGYDWCETPKQILTSGWNTVTFDLTANDWKNEDSGWQHAVTLLNLMDDVRQVSIIFYGDNGEDVYYMDNIRIRRDDGFVIYAGDPVLDVIRDHADFMAQQTNDDVAVTRDQRYAFEAGSDGFTYQDYYSAMAVTSVVQTSTRAVAGAGSLQLNVHLDGSQTAYDEGESYVDMLNSAPFGLNGILNLEDLRLDLYVYCPAGLRGTNASPNTLRVFVKDENWKSLYSAHVDIEEDRWMRISLTPSTTAGAGMYMDSGFDPTAVRILGVNLSAGDSSVSYDGPLYVDCVCFPQPLTTPLSGDLAYTFASDNVLDYFPRWTWGSSWDADAFTNVYITQETLSADAVFAGTAGSSAQRKGVFLLSFDPYLDLENKIHRTVQLRMKFDPPLEGVGCMSAKMSLYDAIDEMQYESKEYNVGGEEWVYLSFDLDDTSSYSSSTPGLMNLSQIGSLAIQFWSSCAYTGTIRLDSVIVGGREIAGTYQAIDGGFVYRSGTNFMLNGSNYFFAGANAEYLFQVNRETSEEVLQLASNMDLRVVRTWAFDEGRNFSFQPERGGWNEMAFERLDRVIAMAGHYDIRLILGLVDNWGHNGGMYEYMSWVQEEEALSLPEGLRSSTNLGSIALHDEFFTNTYAKQWYKDYVEYVLNRTNIVTGRQYKDEPAIMAWEIVNEPRCETDYTENRAYGRRIHDWIEEMTAYVAARDTNHLVAAGEEGGFVMTFSNANTATYQDLPQNYWQYGLQGGCAYADFISDNSPVSNLVQWQSGTAGSPGAMQEEWRSGIPEIGFSTFRLYPDYREYNLYQTNFLGTNSQYYDQREEWIFDHVDISHTDNELPVILEEFGIHGRGWTYGGSYGEIQYSPVPGYSCEDRVMVYSQILDHVEQYSVNGSIFWNLGYTGMWEESWTTCESLGGWFADSGSDATNIVLATNQVLEGSYAYRLDYDYNNGYGKAIYGLYTNEYWLVRYTNSAIRGVNQGLFTWHVYNPENQMAVALALKLGSSWAWHETPTQSLTSGWNRIRFDLTAGNWKCSDSGWQHTQYLTNRLDDVRGVYLMLYQTESNGVGSVYVDDVRIRRDDGFVIYSDDPVIDVIRGHAERMNAR